MKIIFLATADQEEEILYKETKMDVEIIFAQDLYTLLNQTADAYFILTEESGLGPFEEITEKPIFFNSVISTLKELQSPKNISRINGWAGFLQRNSWEIATHDEQIVRKIFDGLQWKYLFSKDEPGLISARIISMIINEAFFAVGDNVSTKEEIDIAMKLGTNYPYGPFEWAEKIGLRNIYDLLCKLAETDKRYNVAPSLKKQITEPG